MPFLIGQEVYQGTEDYKLATAKVSGYDEDRQVLSLVEIEGNIKENQLLKDSTGIEYLVILEGQSDTPARINGSAKPEGTFIDSTSLISDSYAVIQDSYYFQLFSYVIRSSLQQVEYKRHVDDLTHPSGFIMFSDLKIFDKVQTQCRVSEVSLFDFDRDIVFIKIPVSTDPPPNPRVGNLWYSPTRGKTYLYYFDGRQSSWIDVSPPFIPELAQNQFTDFAPGDTALRPRIYVTPIQTQLPDPNSSPEGCIIFEPVNSNLYVNVPDSFGNLNWAQAYARPIINPYQGKNRFQVQISFLNTQNTLVDLSEYRVPVSFFAPPINNTPPGSLWFNEEDNKLYILYQDLDSTQWVPISNQPADPNA